MCIYQGYCQEKREASLFGGRFKIKGIVLNDERYNTQYYVTGDHSY